MTEAISIRRAAPADAPALAVSAVGALEDYPAFAPAGWPRRPTSRSSKASRLRLFVAERHARARRFYEREGWHPVTEPCFDPIPGLPMVEYRRSLG